MLAAIYVGASVITFMAYALDKSATGRGSRRTPETTLHGLALEGLIIWGLIGPRG